MSDHRTLSDVYSDRPLTNAQCRRIVALLGLATVRQPRNDDSAAGATAAPSVESRPYQHAS
ncbi:hypothetical protein [Streptomyces sp. NBC_00271]|uniref:hypothetical protein n=1 Tax=Streptomyces sp. NBC_00271 TaxID=2975697 RepID=UPI002E2BC315|nr:hypothetical protein [Streptomyces sp. NBC_00271]